MNLPCRVGALLGAVLLAGCASSPYSQISGSRYHRAPIDTYPVLILDVDGRSVSGNPVLVDPGRRVIRVQATPGFVDLRETRSLTLDVPACSRTYLVAVKHNRLASDFEVKVDHQESLGGCRAGLVAR